MRLNHCYNILSLIMVCAWCYLPATAQQTPLEYRQALERMDAQQLKLSQWSKVVRTDQTRLLVQYAPPSASRVGKAVPSGSLTLDQAVASLGASRQPLFELTQQGAVRRDGSPAADTASSVEQRLKMINARFPERARRGFVTQPPNSTFLTTQIVTVPAGTNLDVAKSTLRAASGVAAVYEERRYKKSEAEFSPSSLENVYGIQAINAPKVWHITQGKGVVVAVNDTGAYWNHAALAPNMWRNKNEVPGNCKDDDKNGYVDDVYGIDSSRSSRVGASCEQEMVYHPMDCAGHGTHVAGTIAARDNGEFGLSGVAPHAQIMALKGLGDFGYGWAADLARNIVYATDNGADVINNSWGSGPMSSLDPVLADAIRYAAAAGVVNVFAAGNDGADMSFANPANMEEVITVGAIDSESKRADFSNYGARVDVVAPGVSVNSSFPDSCAVTEFDPDFATNVPVEASDFMAVSGTSMAAPHVSGAVALILAANPALRVDEVRAVLRASADDLGTAGFDAFYGAGRVNVERALAIASSGKPLPRFSINQKNVTLYRASNGEFPGLTISGSAITGQGYQVKVKKYDGSESHVQLQSARDVQSGRIASLGFYNREEGRYIVEISSPSNVGAFSATMLVELFAQATVVDSIPLLAYESSNRVLSKGSLLGWSVAGSAPDTGISVDSDKWVIFDQTGTAIKRRHTLQLHPAAFSPFILNASRSPNFVVMGTFLADEALTGRSPDFAISSNAPGSDPSQPGVIGREIPYMYDVVPVVGPPDGYVVTYGRDISLGVFENKVQAVRAKSPLAYRAEDYVVDDIVNADPNAFLSAAQMVYLARAQKAAPMLIAVEVRTAGMGRWAANLVAYTVGATKAQTKATKRYLTSDTSSQFYEPSSDSEMTCALVRRAGEWSIDVVEHASAKRLSVAKGNVGRCALPKSRFVTYLSWDESSMYVNGYDIATGKRGKTPISIRPLLDSFTTTAEGDLAWIEVSDVGSRLVKFDTSAFRRQINGDSLARPTPLSAVVQMPE